MSVAKPIVVVQGETSWLEFQPAARWLAERFHVISEASVIPQAVLCVQRFQGDVAPQKLAALARQFPAAQRICFVGPWCDGELRSGETTTDMLRVHWDAWEAELPIILQPRSVLPRNSSELERVLTRRRGVAGLSRERRVGIVAKSRETRRTLTSLVEQVGASAVELPTATGYSPAAEIAKYSLSALIVDEAIDAAELWQSAAWCQVFQQLPTVITLGFARPTEVARLHAAGVAAVVSKPFRWASLEQALASSLQMGTRAEAA